MRCSTPENYWSRRCDDDARTAREAERLLRGLRWETAGFFALLAATWIADLTFLAWKNGGWFAGGFWWEASLGTMLVAAVTIREIINTRRDLSRSPRRRSPAPRQPTPAIPTVRSIRPAP